MQMCGIINGSNTEAVMGKSMDIGFLRKLAEGCGTPCRCELIEQGWGTLARGVNLVRTGPLKVGETEYAYGFGTHSPSRIRIASTEPLRRFRAVVGIERNAATDSGRARIAPAFFSVEIGGKCVSISPAVRYADGGVAFEAELNGAAEFELIVESPAGIDLANVDWCAPEVETVSGCVMRLGTREFGFGAGSLPVGFRFGGLDAAEFYRRYGIERRSEERGDHTLFSAVSGGADSGLRLTVTMKLFHELPVLEYRVAFENPAADRSRRLSGVDSLQLSVGMPETLRLLRRHGSFQLPDCGFREAFRDSFTPVEESLDGAEKTIRFGAVGGRPSVDWLPCFDLTDGVCNLRIAIGWSGQWSAELVPQPSAAVVDIRAGIEEIDMVLEPGERIELPSVALVWNESGGTERGVNLWRRFLREKIQPRIGGKIVEVPLSSSNWGGMTEAEHLTRIANIVARKMPFELHWIDAGWYGPPGSYSPDEFDSTWSSTTGDWKFNPAILPEKLRNISAASHAAGMKQMLWIEPERAVKNTRIYREHPEYFLASSETGENLLLNLGRPEAWQWCFDTLSELIEENALDWLRIDFNISPLGPWRENDAPDRRGANEIRYVAGLRRLWRSLRKKFPQLVIDNCASGGRRLEFEALRYSIPLWASDMQCADGFDPEWQLTHVAGLSHYLPAFSFGVQNQAGGDTYNFRASMGPGLVVHYFMYACRPPDPAWPHAWLKERLAEYLRAKECFSGDYYCLDAFHAGIGAWTLMQFDRPDLGRGILEAFRGERSFYRSADVRLRGLEPAAEYCVEDADGGFEPFTAAGKQLMEDGITLSLPEKRSSRLVFYRRKDADRR